jgi:hypothetical protein
MQTQTEAWFSTSAGLLVLFTAMLDPRVSSGIALFALIALAIYQWTRKN